MNSFIDSMMRLNTRHSSCERRFTELKSAVKTKLPHSFNILLHALIEHLPLCLQPVFEGMAVHSAIRLIQGIGPFRYARTEVLGMSIKLVSTGLLVAP
jgi:hypothetical protein